MHRSQVMRDDRQQRQDFKPKPASLTLQAVNWCINGWGPGVGWKEEKQNPLQPARSPYSFAGWEGSCLGIADGA